MLLTGMCLHGFTSLLPCIIFVLCKFDSISGVDEQGEYVYFVSSHNSPLEQHLYRTSLLSDRHRSIEQLTREPGWHAVTVEADSGHFLDVFSSLAQPTVVLLKRVNGYKDGALDISSLAVHDESVTNAVLATYKSNLRPPVLKVSATY